MYFLGKMISINYALLTLSSVSKVAVELSELSQARSLRIPVSCHILECHGLSLANQKNLRFSVVRGLGGRLSRPITCGSLRLRTVTAVLLQALDQLSATSSVAAVCNNSVGSISHYTCGVVVGGVYGNLEKSLKKQNCDPKPLPAGANCVQKLLVVARDYTQTHSNK